MVVLIYLLFAHGAGMHIQDVPIEDVVPAIRYEFLVEVLYVATSFFLRISIGLQLWTIVGGAALKGRAAQRVVVASAVLLSSCYNIAFFFIIIFQCTPVDFFWTQFAGVMDGTCFPQNTIAAISYTHAAISCVVDWTLGLMPIWILWEAMMPLRTKATVVGLLGMGTLAGAVAIIRIPYIKQLIYADDFFWSCTPIALTSVLEVAIGILAACFATFRPLISSAYRLATSSRRSKSGKSGATSEGMEKSGATENSKVRGAERMSAPGPLNRNRSQYQAPGAPGGISYAGEEMPRNSGVSMAGSNNNRKSRFVEAPIGVADGEEGGYAPSAGHGYVSVATEDRVESGARTPGSANSNKRFSW